MKTFSNRLTQKMHVKKSMKKRKLFKVFTVQSECPYCNTIVIVVVIIINHHLNSVIISIIDIVYIVVSRLHLTSFDCPFRYFKMPMPTSNKKRLIDLGISRNGRNYLEEYEY